MALEKSKIEKDLENEYKFIQKQIKEAKKEIEDKGLVIESPANGVVRNPAIVIYDTYMKQLINVNKQIKDFRDWQEKTKDEENPLKNMIRK